jgi:steroid delta-isomerase
MDPVEHICLFNAAVRSGDWEPFVARFSDDAVMEFIGPPVGPFVGKTAIAHAYATNPPDDVVKLDGPVTTDGDELIVPYRWAAADGRGTMRVTESDGLIVRLVVTFE